jgi:hypothetical protein
MPLGWAECRQGRDLGLKLHPAKRRKAGLPCDCGNIDLPRLVFRTGSDLQANRRATICDPAKWVP